MTNAVNVASLGAAMTATSSGNVGIGTSSPSAKLVTSGPAQFIGSGAVFPTTGCGVEIVGAPNGSPSYIQAYNRDNSTWQQVDLAGSVVSFRTSGTERARITSSGNLLVGTESDGGGAGTLFSSAKGGTSWHFGPAAVGSGNTFYVLNASNAGVYLASGNTSWTANSDERLKTTLTPFENAAEKVCTLRAGTGRYLADDEAVSRSFLIAQDVQAVLPEAVTVNPDEMGTLGLQYTETIPLLVAAIQEQQAIITALTTRVAALENT